MSRTLSPLSYGPGRPPRPRDFRVYQRAMRPLVEPADRSDAAATGGWRAWTAGAFVLLVALGMLRHAMWRDELQACAAARASRSAKDTTEIPSHSFTS